MRHRQGNARVLFMRSLCVEMQSVDLMTEPILLAEV